MGIENPPYGHGSGSQLPGRSSKAQLSPEQLAILSAKRAPNGLLYQEWTCAACGGHLCDEAVLMGCLRKQCRKCKLPNAKEFNRVGEEQVFKVDIHIEEDTAPYIAALQAVSQALPGDYYAHLALHERVALMVEALTVRQREVERMRGLLASNGISYRS